MEDSIVQTLKLGILVILLNILLYSYVLFRILFYIYCIHIVVYTHILCIKYILSDDA